MRIRFRCRRVSHRQPCSIFCHVAGRTAVATQLVSTWVAKQGMHATHLTFGQAALCVVIQSTCTTLRCGMETNSAPSVVFNFACGEDCGRHVPRLCRRGSLHCIARMLAKLVPLMEHCLPAAAPFEREWHENFAAFELHMQSRTCVASLLQTCFNPPTRTAMLQSTDTYLQTCKRCRVSFVILCTSCCRGTSVHWA